MVGSAPFTLASGSDSLDGTNFCLKIAHLASAREYTFGLLYRSHTNLSNLSKMLSVTSCD